MPTWSLASFLDDRGLLPHGICLTWRPELLWLHAVSDVVTALAYYSIPVALLVFAWRRRDIKFRWMFVLFGVFITACGTTHVMGLWTLWEPVYATEGLVKAVTAISSILTAIILYPLIPKALALPGPAQWEAVNRDLRTEVFERREAEAEVRRLNAQLENRVAERTVELAMVNRKLAEANADLRSEIEARKRIEMDLRDSEVKARAILETAADAIITIDEHGIILTANPAAERMFGYAAAEMIERNVAMLMPAPYAQAHDGYLARYRESGERRIISIGREVEGRRQDGSTFPVDLAIGEAVVAGARIFTGIVRDITERKRAAEAVANLNAALEMRVQQRTVELEAINQRLQGIANNLFEGVMLVDDRGMVAFANPSARRLLQPEEEEEALEGRPVDLLFRLREEGRDLPFAEGPFAQVAERGDVFCSHDAQFVTACGRVLNVACACAPLKERTGMRGTIVSFRDIQTLKAAQREAAQATRLASVGRLAAGIAHEINTPAQYVTTNLSFISDMLGQLMPVLDAAAAADIDYLREEMPLAAKEALAGMQQISRIVLSLKEFSHPGASGHTMADLNRAIENTLVVSRNIWKHAAEVETDLADGLPPVPCHLPEINQVLLNLVSNAVDAIASSGKPLPGRIIISTRRQGGGVTVRVEDSGTGVPEAIRDAIFDPFFTTKEVGKGTGQGLAICRDIIITKHHGRLEVGGEEGRGAVFILWLPCGEPQA